MKSGGPGRQRKSKLANYFEKQPNCSGNQKLQTTVRFEAPILREIEDISNNHGFSLAEAVRRLVRQGLERDAI